MGSFCWVNDPWSCWQHTDNKPHTHIKTVLMHHMGHHDRSAGRPWCWHSSRSLKHQQQHAVWPGKTLSPSIYSWLLLCQTVPQSFLPLVSSIFLLCQSDHWSSVACLNLSSQRRWKSPTLHCFPVLSTINISFVLKDIHGVSRADKQLLSAYGVLNYGLMERCRWTWLILVCSLK